MVRSLKLGVLICMAAFIATGSALGQGSVRIDVWQDEAVVQYLPNTNLHDRTDLGGLYVGTMQYMGINVGPMRSYLKFDLSGLAGTVSDAKLYVYLNDEYYQTDRSIGAYLAGDDWSETTITWNNAPPASGAALSSVPPPLAWGNWYTWDVTAAAASEASGDGILTILLREDEEIWDQPTAKAFAEKDFNSSLGAYLLVTVEAGAEPPVADAGADQVVEQTSPTGAAVTLDGSASTGALAFEWTENGVVLGTEAVITVTLGPGVHNLVLTVTGAGGATDSDEVQVTVQDTIAPTLTCPADITVEAQGPDGAVVEFTCTATDACDPDPTVVCEPPSGSLFPVGTTQVNCTATDDAGNVATGSFTVTVNPAQDTTPPQFSLQILKPVLWPPNGALVLAAVVTGVKDDTDPSPAVVIAVTANEPVRGPGGRFNAPPWRTRHHHHGLRTLCYRGPGQTAPDWKVVQVGDTYQIWLRAERYGASTGRIYTIQVTVTDAAGNSASDGGTVTVPHDQGRNKDKGKPKK